MNQKKVLIVATAKLYLAGITTVLLNIANCIKDEYHLSFVLAESGDTRIVSKLEKLGAVYILPSRQKHLVMYLCKLRKLMQEGKYDVVHIHGNSATMAFDLLVAYWCKIPKRITHCHSCAPQPKWKQLTLKKLVNKYVTNPVACSIDSGNMLYNRSFTEIQNSIDCDLFRFSAEARKRLRDDLKIEQDAFVIGHLGRFSREKNQVRLIHIFNIVYKTEPKARLILCGDGDTLEECKSMATAFHLQDMIFFPGEVNNPEEYYSAMDVLVMPSYFEGFPLVGIEAQASDLPCVFSSGITREVQISEKCHFPGIRSSLPLQI